MLTLHTYGHSGKTSTGYYFLGIADNNNKFAQAGSVVEMAWFMGFTTGAPSGSNLGLRRINTYTNLGAGRFGTLLTGTTQLVPSITGKRANVSPLDAIWTLYH